MSSFALVAPILPGKEQLDAESFRMFIAGDERDEYVTARRAPPA